MRYKIFLRTKTSLLLVKEDFDPKNFDPILDEAISLNTNTAEVSPPLPIGSWTAHNPYWADPYEADALRRFEKIAGRMDEVYLVIPAPGEDK